MCTSGVETVFVCVKTGFFFFFFFTMKLMVMPMLCCKCLVPIIMYLPCAKDVRLREGFDLLCNVNF